MSPEMAGVAGFLAMVILMLIGMPIAAVMMGVGVAGGMMAFGDAFFVSTASIAWGTLSENGLTAIPLFVLLGELLLRSGMADGMYRAFAAWFGRLPGGLLHTNIGCCALFAATSGSSVATAATIGTVALPSLQRHGYRMSDSLGSLAAGVLIELAAGGGFHLHAGVHKGRHLHELKIIHALHGIVCWNGNHGQVINLFELRRFGHGRSRHAGQFVVTAEKILIRDGRQHDVFTLNGHALFGLQSLVQAIRKPPSIHDAACKFIHNHDFAIFDNIFLIFLEQVRGA